MYSLFMGMVVCLFFVCLFVCFLFVCLFVFLLAQAWLLAVIKLMWAWVANACALKTYRENLFTDLENAGLADQLAEHCSNCDLEQ